MPMKILSKYEKEPIELNYVVKYDVYVETPETSVAKTYENRNDMVVVLEVPKVNYKDEDVQKLLKWAEQPVSKEGYYRDLAVNLQHMEHFERTVVFTHAEIRTNVIADTKADFVTIEVYVSQKIDKYVGVMFGEKLEETYAKAWEKVAKPPRMNIVVPLPVDEPTQGTGITKDKNKDYAASNDIPFQVTEITSDSITIQTKNLTGKSILIRELEQDYKDLGIYAGKFTKRSEDFKYEGSYRIDNLKGLTHYNIVVIDKNYSNTSAHSPINVAIRTFHDFDTVVTKSEYDTTYKSQFERSKNKHLPSAWGNLNTTRAKMSDFGTFFSFFVRGNVVDTVKYNEGVDGINDRNESTKDYFLMPVKRYHFPSIGLSVYECPFKPNYFNTDWNMAILGRTQCYVEVGKKKIYYTLKDLDDLDYSHRFDVFAHAGWSSFRIVLSASADVITIFTLGTVYAAKEGLVKLLTSFLPSDEVTISNAVIGVGTDLYKGNLSKNDLTDWGIYVFEALIPFIGTYNLIENSIDFQPTITETSKSAPPRYGDIVGSTGTIDGIFFRSN